MWHRWSQQLKSGFEGKVLLAFLTTDPIWGRANPGLCTAPGSLAGKSNSLTQPVHSDLSPEEFRRCDECPRDMK